ncbi:Lrp/AsnC family transcriptional regulator [Streptomyces sp. NPDC048002]|uniref:Lrp/AsnC family transcriptional regulator n=1 Tax=Streptomyces sp. NPDC048002 TaxID=3154344 RepID=UPI0033C57843
MPLWGSEVINALQINPRAPWAAVAQALETDAVTAARRWQRISERGLAWVTGYPGPRDESAHAVVEVECEARTTDAVAAAVARDPEAITVEETAGARDLLVTVAASSLAGLVGYVTSRVRLLPGVRSTRTNLITEGFTEGAQWRLGALDAAARRAVAPRAPAETPAAWAPGLRDDLDRRIVVELSRDGRVSATEPAARFGNGTSTAARRLRRIIETRSVLLRCEVARSAVGRPVTATLWASVRPEDLTRAGKALARLPQVRLAAAVAGSSNLICIAWLSSLSELPGFETDMALRVPALTVTDRTVTIRPVKHSARMLDHEGRALEAVPADLWARRETAGDAR